MTLNEIFKELENLENSNMNINDKIFKVQELSIALSKINLLETNLEEVKIKMKKINQSLMNNSIKSFNKSYKLAQKFVSEI